MNLVDSCGWLEYFANGPNSNFFSTPIEDTENLIVPTICVFEVFKRVSQQRGEHEALKAISAMLQGNVKNLDLQTSITAAKESLENELPLADSIVLATAKISKATIWSQDEHFKKIAEIKYKKSRKL